MATPTRFRADPHDGDDTCLPWHCWSHDVDETGPGYQVCGECGHVYPTARSLRAAYRRVVTQMARQELRAYPVTAHRPADPDDPFGAAYQTQTRWQTIIWWARSMTVRASKIYFCQECIHDF